MCLYNSVKDLYFDPYSALRVDYGKNVMGQAAMSSLAPVAAGTRLGREI